MRVDDSCGDGRRNLTHALITLGGVLLVLVAVPGIPSGYLAEVHGYRPLQLAPLALCVALPQLVALPAVAALCNLRRVDCRWVLATGLALSALSCLLGSGMTSDWIRDNFYVVQAIQVVAQPMAVIPLLMLATDGMTPLEGPFASSWFNTVKGFAAVVGTGLTEGVTTLREHFHSHVPVDQMGNRPRVVGLLQGTPTGLTGLDHQAMLALVGGHVREQALVLACADMWRLMAILSVALVVLIPFVPTRIYPPGSVSHA